VFFLSLNHYKEYIRLPITTEESIRVKATLNILKKQIKKQLFFKSAIHTTMSFGRLPLPRLQKESANHVRKTKILRRLAGLQTRHLHLLASLSGANRRVSGSAAQVVRDQSSSRGSAEAGAFRTRQIRRGEKTHQNHDFPVCHHLGQHIRRCRL